MNCFLKVLFKKFRNRFNRDLNAADSELKIALSPRRNEKYSRYISRMPKPVFI